MDDKPDDNISPERLTDIKTANEQKGLRILYARKTGSIFDDPSDDPLKDFEQDVSISAVLSYSAPNLKGIK